MVTISLPMCLFLNNYRKREKLSEIKGDRHFIKDKNNVVTVQEYKVLKTHLLVNLSGLYGRAVFENTVATDLPYSVIPHKYFTITSKGDVYGICTTF